MSRDWTQDELQAASTAMGAAGHLTFEEFTEEVKRQDTFCGQESCDGCDGFACCPGIH